MREIKILFLNPPFKDRFSRSSRSPGVAKGGTLYYPIWLAYAAGVAQKAGYDVRLIDAPAQRLGIDDLFRKLGGFAPDIAVIDTSTPSIYNDIKITKEVKVRYPNLFTTLVGTHPSALPVETLGLSAHVDAVCVGEYDYTIRDLAEAMKNDLPLDGVNGLAFRTKGEFRVNKERPKIEDLDEIPFVSSVYKKHLDYRDYFFAAANYPMMMIMTGRGCPFRCTFCVYPQVFHSRKYRMRSAENVVNEFEYIKRNFPGVREIGIEDDCFSGDQGHVRRICELLIRRDVRIKWYCNVRGDLDHQLLLLMKRAGCRLVTVGFESGCQDILDNMHKGEKVERYYRFASDARKAGILVHGCMMIGNLGDTRKTVEESYAFAEKINCDSMQFYPLYVYPGTEAYEWARRNKYLKTDDFSRWLTPEGFHNCVLDIPGLTADEMMGLCDRYLKRYHLRPLYLIEKIAQAVTNPAEGYRTCKAAKIFFSKLLRVGASRRA